WDEAERGRSSLPQGRHDRVRRRRLRRRGGLGGYGFARQGRVGGVVRDIEADGVVDVRVHDAGEAGAAVRGVPEELEDGAGGRGVAVDEGDVDGAVEGGGAGDGELVELRAGDG